MPCGYALRLRPAAMPCGCALRHRQVDAALSGFGMAMGPFEMADLAGNDIGYNVRRERGIVDKDTGKPTDPTQR